MLRKKGPPQNKQTNTLPPKKPKQKLETWLTQTVREIARFSHTLLVVLVWIGNLSWQLHQYYKVVFFSLSELQTCMNTSSHLMFITWQFVFIAETDWWIKIYNMLLEDGITNYTQKNKLKEKKKQNKRERKSGKYSCPVWSHSKFKTGCPDGFFSSTNSLQDNTRVTTAPDNTI